MKELLLKAADYIEQRTYSPNKISEELRAAAEQCGEPVAWLLPWVITQNKEWVAEHHPEAEPLYLAPPAQAEELAKLRAQLSRYREELTDILNGMARCGCGYSFCSKCREVGWLSNLLAETPEQSMASVKVQAVRYADEHLYSLWDSNWSSNFQHGYNWARANIKAYADRLEQETK